MDKGGAKAERGYPGPTRGLRLSGPFAFIKYYIYYKRRVYRRVVRGLHDGLFTNFRHC